MAADLSPGAASLLYRSGAPKDYAVSGAEVTIGFDTANQIRVPIEGVSRRHAKVTFDGKDFWVEDAGSSNGTFLNGVPVRRRERLRHLDVLGLGRRTELIFVRKAVAARRTRRMGIVTVWLAALDGPDAGERREIPRGLITLGRAPSNNVVVHSELVSKSHARIERLGVELILTDLQSANGTLVNGKPVTSRTLEDGDEISLGKARSFRVQIQQGEIETNEINASPSVDSTGAGLPTDWKTRLEWTPEEKAVFDKFRSEAPPRPGAAKPQGRSTPKGQAQPAPAAGKAEAKREVRAEAKSHGAAGKAPSSAPSPESASGREKPVPAPPAATSSQAPPSATRVPPERARPDAAPPPHVEPPAAPVSAVGAPARSGAVPASAPLSSTGPTIAVGPPPPATGPAISREEPRPRVVLEGKTQKFSVGAGDHDIGRVPQCALCVESPQISRRHAILHVTATQATIEDLKSANGTFLNGVRITQPQALRDGDEIRFGDLAFHVRIAAPLVEPPR